MKLLIFIYTAFQSIIKFDHNLLQRGRSNEICQFQNRQASKVFQNSDKRVSCWNIKDSIFEYKNEEIQTEITHGLYHKCQIYRNQLRQLVECEGQNTHGQTNIPDVSLLQNGKYLSSGFLHTCGQWVYNNQLFSFSLQCWGDNSQGQTNVPIPKSKWRQLEYLMAGLFTSCALIKNEQIQCWGRNDQEIQSQQGISPHPSRQNNLGKVAIDFGNNGTVCAIKVMNTGSYKYIANYLDCWGRCESNSCTIPAEHKQGAVLVTVGHDHVCNLTGFQNNNIKTAKLNCWGGDEQGQSSVPKIFNNQVESVVASQQQTCAMKVSFQLMCFGKETAIPSSIKYQAIDVSAGGNHTCAIFNGRTKCFGDDQFGQLEVPNTLQIDSLQINSGWDFTCGIDTTNNISCFGLNILDQTNYPPQLKETNVKVHRVVTGLSHSCAVQFSNSEAVDLVGDVTCWGGHDEQGQTSLEDQQKQRIKFVAVGDEHTCVFKFKNMIEVNSTHETKCFGNNKMGQLEVPENIKHQLIQSIEAGDGHTCADTILNQNTNYALQNLYCWGSDSHGQSSVPEEFRKGKMRQTSLSAGTSHNCLITFDSAKGEQSARIQCWGQGQHEGGNLFGGEMRPMLVATGFEHDCQINEERHVACFGQNEQAQCDVPSFSEINDNDYF